MSEQTNPAELPAAAEGRSEATPSRLQIFMDVAAGGFRFEWLRPDSDAPIAVGHLLPSSVAMFRWYALEWRFQMNSTQETDRCGATAPSVRALLKRIRQRLPLAPDGMRLGFRLDAAHGNLEPGRVYELAFPAGEEWSYLARPVRDFVKLIEALPHPNPMDAAPQQKGRAALLALIQQHLRPSGSPDLSLLAAASGMLRLRVTLEMARRFIQFDWTDAEKGTATATGRVSCSGRDELAWELTTGGRTETAHSKHHLNSIRGQLRRWVARLPVANKNFSARSVMPGKNSSKPVVCNEPPFGPSESPWPWLEDNLQAMAKAFHLEYSPLGRIMDEMDPLTSAELLRSEERLPRKEKRRAEEERRRQAAMQRLAEERRRRAERAAANRRASETRKPAVTSADLKSQISNLKSPARERAPLPPVPVRIEMPPLAFQDTAFPLPDLRAFFLRERAARWWVSNQSDDLLALPYCRIERLDYQVRSALRVLGPLRGRALLSDEVGLGKTIEAGLVLKEWLTRGMVKRFLVLTVPSLVDQWEEELSEKFNLSAVTTNHPVARSDTAQFWRENRAIIASLHTLKQPAQLEVARTVNWDLVIVDEAHYLRNRESQAWQAVNALPRQFLLLLTATPVQNSLEELYNLVTLLQPGQLPTPREFRARFLDPKHPRRPREPEELRRLLGQVMIRNTRANAGIHLPPRRAETVIFAPDEDERAFWQSWESELRAELSRLTAGQASLWGRLLLQTAGSSPAAWLGALEKFPNPAAARAWREHAPLESSWRKKCSLLPPLTRAEGGLVIFTQFLETQAAIAESLRAAGVETFVINGATPAPQRQPVTEEFRKRGGALLLTHSGTEGRNLQFCHRLVNFDLPWNPMEIEQRIGRLHRLGQQHPVRIYNLVQAGTLQEHLLQILQEKLNLFELVVGETGLVLGERFSSDEFAEEVFRRWRESDGRVAEALQTLGDELAAARDGYEEVKQLDETLFAKDYESL
jgi:superfamily II DNA or RNA helicase